VIEIDVIGNEAAISAAKVEIAPLATAPLRSFQHKGALGEAGVYGLLTSLLPVTIPPLIEVLKRLVVSDRDLKISFNGFVLKVSLLLARGRASMAIIYIFISSESPASRRPA
jgi:hypothetical protein